MWDIGAELRRKREAWEQAVERYQRLLAAKENGNIKSPPMSGMPSGGCAGSKTEKLFLDIDRAKEQVRRRRTEYVLARQMLRNRARAEFQDDADFRIVWECIVENTPPRKVAAWNHVDVKRVYNLKKRIKKVLVDEK